MSDLSNARLLLAQAIHAQVDAVPEDARIGAFERWDSIAHMHLLLAIEQRIGRQLDPEEVVRIECVADVAEVLRNGALPQR
jgi:acyl carrier protein